MTSAEAPSLTFDKTRYHEHVGRLFDPTLKNLSRLLTSTLIFHCAFLLIGAVELGAFLSFFAFVSHSSALAFMLALFFLTLFSYFVLRLYFQGKRPEQLQEIVDAYLNQCKQVLRYQAGIPEHHIALAQAATKLAANLHELEYLVLTPPAFFPTLKPTFEKFSCFCHWKDLHRMKEILLGFAIEEHIRVVKCEPTNLEVHAALANAYVMLSSLYADPRKFEGNDDERWIPPEKYSKAMQKQFRATAERAIEEFKILNDYAPDDPWVHVQLAYSYHDLQMPEEEIKEYEMVLKLRPNDKDTLFKLGVLYFQQGLNAQGLRIYEMLQRTHYKKAENLIKFYGAFEN